MNLRIVLGALKSSINKPLVMYLLGIVTVLIVASILPQNIQAQDITNTIQTPFQTTNPFSEDNREKPSPQNYLDETKIRVYQDRVIIEAENIKWASFTDTKSMLPIIDKDTNALQIEPVCPTEVQVGDIVSYKSEYADGIIIHRVVYKGEDAEGPYFILKGDNNPSNDPGRIRCDQIQRRVIGILY